MATLPPLDQPFAYQRHNGEPLLLSEVAQAIEAELAEAGHEVGEEAIVAVLRAFRQTTESIALGRAQDVESNVAQLVRRQRVLLTSETIKSVLRLLMHMLERQEVVGVTYFER